MKKKVCAKRKEQKYMYTCTLYVNTDSPGGVRTTIAKHHGRYSKSDHLCQGGVEWTSLLWSEYSLITL